MERCDRTALSDLAASTTCLKYFPVSGSFALRFAQQAGGALAMRLNGMRSARLSRYAAEGQVATSRIAPTGTAAAVIAQPITNSFGKGSR
jgi:hypothetical protein